jgi:hypothetical protein
LDQVLAPEVSRALKLRFGLVAFASVLYALRRNVCVEHPKIAERALKRLLEAADVHNPGAYFFRVFSDELAAFQLLPEPSPEDLALELERERAEALRARQLALQAQLERVQCVDVEATARVRAELEAVQRERRRRQGLGGVPQAGPVRGEGAPPGGPPSGAQALSPAEQQAESERVLAMLRKRSAA